MADADRTLLLIPTSGERDRLLKHFDVAARPDWRVELCGFGLIAAAASTMRLIADDPPARVILAGIAGGLGSAAAVGTAHWFGEVVCDGIGVGQGDGFVPASDMGWHQWSDPSDPIGDRLTIDCPDHAAQNVLVSVCAASADSKMAQKRGQDPLVSVQGKRAANRSPPATLAGVLAEDMEAFGVAMACRMMGVPCQVVRGISNVAGDRVHSRWKIDAALDAVGERLRRIR